MSKRFSDRRFALRLGATLAVGALLLLWLCPELYPSSVTTLPDYLTNPKTYRVTYSFFFDIQSRVNSLQLWFPRPVEWDSQRDVTIEEVSPDPTEEYFDPVHGNGVYYWEFRNKRGRLTVRERYVLTAYDLVYDIDPSLVGEYDTSSELYRTYTKSEDFIEAGDEAIKETAKEIVGDETNPYYKARLIYDWVEEYMRYQYIEGLGGAKFAFERGYGECGDYAALFSALLRAVGVPARPVVGFWAKSGAQRPGKDTLPYHVWAEFYLPGFGWAPADPERGARSREHDSDYYFARLDTSERLISSKNFNIQLPAGVMADLFQHYWYERSGGSLRDWRLILAVEEIGS